MKLEPVSGGRAAPPAAAQGGGTGSPPSDLALRHVAARFAGHAAADPGRAAVLVARGRRLERTTYGELSALAARAARGLAQRGLRPGQRVSLFVRPGPELIALTYALLALGAVPVLIDPGMGRPGLLRAVERSAPEVLIGVRRALLAARLFPRAFESVRLRICADGWFPGAVSLQRLCAQPAERLAIAPRAETDPAAVLFTSGSTGPAKGVLATHGILWAQVEQLEALYGLGPGEVDLCCLPLFALFDTALGGTSVFPELDPSRPARCRPEDIRFAIEASGASLAFGSPAIWRRVLPALERSGQRLASLRRVLIAGAPVPLELIERLRPRLAPDGEVHTPYGATECLPVSSISGAELLEPVRAARNRSGAGNCIGRPAPRVEARVIALQDGPLERLEQARELPDGERGELIVTGPTVTPLYISDAQATRAAKLVDERGRLWHRMGDLVRRDPSGELWFLGRCAHRLETPDGLFGCVEYENLFLGDPRVARVAVVGSGPAGAQRPLLILELPAHSGGRFRRRLVADLFDAARRRSPLADQVAGVLFHPGFPVDVRHNAKIDRGALARWAAVQSARGRCWEVPAARGVAPGMHTPGPAERTP